MTKIYTVVLNLQGKRGGISVPQVTVSTESAAREGAAKRQEDILRLMEYPIVQPTGPDGGEPVMTVKQFLNWLGVENVGHFIDSTDVHDSELLRVPEKKIILAH